MFLRLDGGKVSGIYSIDGCQPINDLSDANWNTLANNASSAGAVNFNLFVYYKTKGKIYGAKGGNAFWAYDPTAVATFKEDAVNDETGGAMSSPSFTTVAQGIVHPADDVLWRRSKLGLTRSEAERGALARFMQAAVEQASV